MALRVVVGGVENVVDVVAKFFSVVSSPCPFEGLSSLFSFLEDFHERYSFVGEGKFGPLLQDGDGFGGKRVVSELEDGITYRGGCGGGSSGGRGGISSGERCGVFLAVEMFKFGFKFPTLLFSLYLLILSLLSLFWLLFHCFSLL